MKNVEIFNDSFQNYKTYGIPHAQLILTDVPYVLGKNAYASNPAWYKDGDNKNGESELAGKQFFSSDSEFRPAEFMHFCSKMLIKEPKQSGKSPCMILFCEYEQQFQFIQLGKKYGLMHYIPLVFRKNFSAQVLKANMKVVGNCEYGLILYRDKLPKFNNNGQMIFNCFDWVRDNSTPKVHPTQKPVPLLERLIEIFTDRGDVIIDPCAGSGTTLRAAANLGRKAYGFEVNKEFLEGRKKKYYQRLNQDYFKIMKYDEFLKKEIQKKGRSKPRHIESQIQRQMVSWFRLQYPRYIIAAIPNGGQRSSLEAKIMKGEGVLAGFSDLIIIAQGNVLFIEVKTKDGKQSDLQIKFQSDVERLGFQYSICRSLEDFIMTVEKWVKSKFSV